MVNIHVKKVELSNGETIGYRERAGGKDIVLLIHGNMTSSVHWDVVLDALPETYKVYAVDLRGFGESSYHKRITAIKDFSDDIKLFVDALGLKQFSIVGWSLGGAVSQQFCADYPGYAKKLFLLASASSRGYAYYRTGADGLPDETDRLETLDEIFDDDKRNLVQSAYDTNNTTFLRELWDMLIYNAEKKPDEARYKKYLKDMMTQRNLAECYHALNVFNISNHHNGLVQGVDQVKEIDIPVMITRGDQDMVVTKEMTDELREDYGDQAVYRNLTNCGHSPQIDDLDQLLRVMDEFLQDSLNQTRSDR